MINIVIVTAVSENHVSTTCLALQVYKFEQPFCWVTTMFHNVIFIKNMLSPSNIEVWTQPCCWVAHGPILPALLF